MTLPSYITNLQPGLIELVGSILGILLSVLLMAIQRRTGIQIRIAANTEIDQLRERLEAALANAAALAVLRNLPAPIEEHVDEVVSYLKAGAPDVLSGLAATEDALKNRAELAVRNYLAGLK